MELPKSASELAIWLGMQFPVLASAILLAYWAVKYAIRLYDKKSDETQKLNDRLIAEKDKQISKLEERIRQLESEVAELRETVAIQEAAERADIRFRRNAVIILGMVAYYVVAIGLIAAVLYLTVRQAKRRMDATYERLVQEIQQQRDATPPLPPPLPSFEIDGAVDDEDEDNEEVDDEDVPDLNAPALQPIAPLLLRAAKVYLNNPLDRERLLRSLSEALSSTATSSPAPSATP